MVGSPGASAPQPPCTFIVHTRVEASVLLINCKTKKCGVFEHVVHQHT